uniref:Uncharacterized protein n=1 Tax=Romanomermis culicivorax TaxID=13658 RepID=A0A915LEU0_ROMCU
MVDEKSCDKPTSLDNNSRASNDTFLDSQQSTKVDMKPSFEHCENLINFNLPALSTYKKQFWHGTNLIHEIAPAISKEHNALVIKHQTTTIKCEAINDDDEMAINNSAKLADITTKITEEGIQKLLKKAAMLQKLLKKGTMLKKLLEKAAMLLKIK